ncbi:MAG: hypothetical protein AAGD23_09470 [Pseudomonadota bacterium]
METADATEIIACLPKDRTLFWYHRDRYAAYLLEHAVQDNGSIATIKAGPYSRLLSRPAIKTVVASAGAGHITSDELAMLWPTDPLCYRLTLGIWGDDQPFVWNQTSRRGSNLVLQLNFSNAHDSRYRDLISHDPDYRPFDLHGHPTRRGFHTLAWARLDINLNDGTALIEEVQTDWVRLALHAREQMAALAADPEAQRAAAETTYRGRRISPDDLETYVRDVLNRHIPTWDEAILTAVLWFLWEELAVSHVWMHTADCGQRLKRIHGTAPPRSLYSQLPRRFCFQETSEPPPFLDRKSSPAYRSLEKSGALRFWRIDDPARLPLPNQGSRPC